ncbi:MAG: S9 family peptidase [Chloroflexi bacterium]|nr:S9 family peptidase [Chloroflexota bacterium]
MRNRLLIIFSAMILLTLCPALAEVENGRYSGPINPENIACVSGPQGFTLSPDGHTVFFLMKKDGCDQIFRMPVKGGYPLQVTASLEDHDVPNISPDGKRLVTIIDNQLWVMNIDGGNPLQLTFHGADKSCPTWSPDGGRIAYYSRQRGWDQIWTVSPEGGEPKRITEGPYDNYNSEDFTRTIEWSPDSKYFVYTSWRGEDLTNSDIYLIPSSGGKEVRITNVPKQFDENPRFTPDGKRIVFISDRDGWYHIYIMDIDGGNVKQLTSGEFEDYFPEVSPDGKLVAFIRNVEGKWDICTVPVEGGEITPVSKRDGMHWITGWLPDSKWIVFGFDSPKRPYDLWKVNLVTGDEIQLTDSLAAGLTTEVFQAPERVSYKTRDGLTVYGYLYKPFDMKPGRRYPAVINPHGGPTWQFTYTWEPFLQFLAQQGYVVLGPDIRGSLGYGNKFRRANFGVWGVKDTMDLVDGADWLKKQSYVDPDKIAVYGGSYGGYMTLCALAFHPGVFACGVDLYGDSEIAESYNMGDRWGRLDLLRQMGKPDENKETYRNGSPVYAAENIDAPLLILHGEEDPRVVPYMSEKMIEALKIEYKFFEYHFYEGEPHGFYGTENIEDSYERIYEFLEKYLKGVTKD